MPLLGFKVVSFLPPPLMKLTGWLADPYARLPKAHRIHRKFTGKNVGFDLNPGVETATPQSLRSNWRNRRVRNNPRNVGDTGEEDANRCCQENRPFGLV
jgi:hypothetical protein